MRKPMITPQGIENLKEELDHLWRAERPETRPKFPGPPAWETDRRMRITIIIENTFVKLLTCAFCISASASMIYLLNMASV